MLYTVTLRDVSRDQQKTTIIWARDAFEAMKRAVGRCTRYQVPVKAEETKGE